MARISDLINHSLRWEQPSTWRQEYQLRSADHIAGKLEFASSWKAVATATSSEGEWTFDRPGFWQRRAIVYLNNPDAPLAVYQYKTWSNNGSLTLADGRVFQASTNFWTTRFVIHDEAMQPVLNLFNIRGFMRSSCELQISPTARDLPELPWLVPFCWYLVIMLIRDASTTAAAAT